MEIQDQILSIVLDTQREVRDLAVRIGNVETVQDKVYKLSRFFMSF